MTSNENFDKNKMGYVFNIQRYSVHDGPGIRTMIFLKGCPLRCSWCSNPESHERHPEIAYNKNKCIGTNECIRCIEICLKGAIKKGPDDKIMIDRELCNNCGACAEVCPAKAITVYGKLMSVEEVLKEAEADSIFFSRSGGGITISGGEPFTQAEFTIELLKEAKKRRHNTAIETTGYTDWENLSEACKYLNSILYDIKSMDSEKHKKFTGVSNELILDNFKKMCTAYPSLAVHVRTPVIPGFNDTEGDIRAIIAFIKDFPNVKYELLPYHRLGQQKYEFIGKDYPCVNLRPDDNKMKVLNEIVNNSYTSD
ncbi:glycyl-radical enzyme activating protein [Dehalobacterium formicoaceticum]|uniref:Glycyl-radical enzyme activating protein n=2 Tax=Dehalobacterium formicoaceticum TaxID=51515 RepID=A0ABT1Y228_9FIRM|nr:glycyl-radical enzyme activating protein [Dehalobacterium formicoaceticum]MCR6544922.1 glycyl-radical enzyme activating protein [Dehalobacterium formicoaceticum]